MNKRIFWAVTLALLIGLICVVCALCATANPTTSAVRIDENQSWLRGFYIAGDTAKIKCRLFIENQSDHNANVMMVGYFEADQKAGLLQESQLLGCAEEYPYSTIFTVPSGGGWFNVDFVGTYGGVHKKQNRLIPEIQLIVVQQPLTEKMNGTVPRTAMFEETLTFATDTAEVNVAVSISPDSGENFGISAYTGSGGLLDEDTHGKILAACQPMPIDSTAKLETYLQTICPALADAGHLLEGDLPHEIQIYTDDVMVIRFCRDSEMDGERFMGARDIYVSLESGIVLGMSKVVLA